MSTSRTSIILPLLPLLALAGCAMAAPKGEGTELPPRGAADSAAAWIEHGAVLFEDDSFAELGPEGRAHSWNFDLTDEASVTFETLSGGGQDPDTILFLLDVTDGTRRFAAEPDDDGGQGYFSHLFTGLPAGEYEVVVTGYDFTSVGPFALRSKCRGDGCAPEVDYCSGFDLQSGLNPCADGFYCKIDSPDSLDGACEPAQELYDAALAEYGEHFSLDPELRAGEATRGIVVGRIAADGDGSVSVNYQVDLWVHGRQVRFYFDANGDRNRDLLSSLFRMVPDSRMLHVGEPTIFASAPAGETLDRFLREVETNRVPTLVYPLQTIDHGDSLKVIGTLPLYEAEAMAELQARFPDHLFEHNTVRLTTTGGASEALIATFAAE